MRILKISNILCIWKSKQWKHENSRKSFSSGGSSPVHSLLAPIFPSHPSPVCLPLTLPLPACSRELMPPFTLRLSPSASPFLTLSSSPPLPLSLPVCVAVSFSPPRRLERLTDRLPISSSPPLPLALPPRPPWPAAALMVVSRVGPRGLIEVEDSLGRPGPAWTAVLAAYTTVFIPLSSSLYSSKALHFFLWVSRTREGEGKGEMVVEDRTFKSVFEMVL